ncbi:MAG: hypothetical protein ACC682_10355 [Gemmatimonadota bacterium]
MPLELVEDLSLRSAEEEELLGGVIHLEAASTHERDGQKEPVH